jgi:hypothetical protein
MRQNSWAVAAVSNSSIYCRQDYAMLSPDYYRNQATCCLRMARETSDAILARRLSGLAADFMQAAQDVEVHESAAAPPDPQHLSPDYRLDRE